MQGVPSIRVLDFTERTEMPQKRPTMNGSAEGYNYITTEQFEPIKAKIERIEGILKELEEKDDGKSAVRASKSAKSEQ